MSGFAVKKIDRREFVKAGVAAGLGFAVRAKSQAKEPQKKPNVLYVFSDQHRAASLPGMPYNEAEAPNIAAFGSANFSMDMCLSNYPLCTPYRGILMTGKYPHQSGLLAGGVKMNPGEFTLTKAFKAAGYHTSYIGKWHLGRDSHFVPPGPLRFDIDDYLIWSKTDRHYSSYTFDPVTGQKLTPPGWNATSMTDQAIALLKAKPKGPDAQPWFMEVSWNPPHPPFDPPAADQARYAGTLKRRPNVKLGRGPKPLHSEQDFHAAEQGYFGGITGVDLEFARLLKTLDEIGAAHNTIVIYTSDHGEMMGSQERMGKRVPFDESIQVPFMVRYPGVTVKGGRSKALFAAIDIYPTVCGLAGLPVPKHCEGRDLSGLMRGEAADAAKIVFLMNTHDRANNPYSGDKNTNALTNNTHPAEKDIHDTASETDDPDEEGNAERKAGGKGRAPQGPIFRGARTDQYTYAVNENGRWVLYDNLADPYQMKNLVDDVRHKELMDGFDAQIKAWMQHTGDPFSYPAIG